MNIFLSLGKCVFEIRWLWFWKMLIMILKIWWSRLQFQESNWSILSVEGIGWMRHPKWLCNVWIRRLFIFVVLTLNGNNSNYHYLMSFIYLTISGCFHFNRFFFKIFTQHCDGLLHSSGWNQNIDWVFGQFYAMNQFFFSPSFNSIYQK